MSGDRGAARPSRWQRKPGGQPRPILIRRDMVIFVPAVALAGLWFGLAGMFLLGLTAVLVGWMTRPLPEHVESAPPPCDAETGLPLRAEAVEVMTEFLATAGYSARGTACLVLGLDDPAGLTRHLSVSERAELMRRCAERISGTLREADRIARLDGARFAILLSPTLRPNLESMIQLSARLQQAVEDPVSIGARTIQVTCHLGFCLMARAAAQTGAALLEGAETAANEAERQGRSAIRAYSSELGQQAKRRSALSDSVADALESGQIRAYFQPQLSSDTGDIAGLQAIPRWLHRERGILTEAEILPAIETAGARTRFAEVMFFQVLGALRDFARHELEFGPVSIALSQDLLSNPKLCDRLKWDLDRFGIAPARIVLILRQDAIARLDDDMIAHNIGKLAQIGCGIEMSGFGNGPISIAVIKRVGAQRLRIHRSFVSNVDNDPEQQRIVAAMVSLCEGLGLTPVAEGAATIREHSMLAQLGCVLVQGRAIAGPMPQDELEAWAARHRAKLALTPRIGRDGKC